jgi:hypothetical protein
VDNALAQSAGTALDRILAEAAMNKTGAHLMIVVQEETGANSRTLSRQSLLHQWRLSRKKQVFQSSWQLSLFRDVLHPCTARAHPWLDHHRVLQMSSQCLGFCHPIDLEGFWDG